MKRRNPSTSNDAYESMKGEPISEHHQKIIAALTELNTGISEEIARHLGMDAAKIYRRMSELERFSIIRKTGTQRKTSSGRNSFVYELVAPAPRKEDIKPNYPLQQSLFI